MSHTVFRSLFLQYPRIIIWIWGTKMAIMKLGVSNNMHMMHNNSKKCTSTYLCITKFA